MAERLLSVIRTRRTGLQPARAGHGALLSEAQTSTPAALLGLTIALALTVLVYWPGLSGGFLFDDFPNLEKLGARGPIRSFDLLREFVSGGIAGPTGRPLSLLSFLVDARDWPADPFPFKRTNLIIHLATGASLFVVTRKLLASIGRSAGDAACIAALAAALWLVNPFLVSTTLYVVQRMSQLATFFVLAGIWCYLHGRWMLASNPVRGYATLAIGVPLCTLLAVLCKENGALLPLLVLVIHVALRHQWQTAAPSKWWTAAFLGVPSALIAGYLLAQIPGAERSYSVRDFSLAERLLSQPRFLWDYLYHLLVPHIQTQGLWQDGRVVSTSLLQPWTTAPALIGVIGLLGAAWLGRARLPLLSVAVLFFFAGHLLESTTLPLELYFEHRNYLPAAFLFLPVAAAGYDFARRQRRGALAASAVAAVVAGYAAATWQHASLWGDEDRLLLVWAHVNPDSPRAQVSAAQVWLRRDRPDRALATLEAANERMPGRAFLISNRLAFRAGLGVMSLEELEAGARQILETRFDPQSTEALELLVSAIISGPPDPARTRMMNELLRGVREELDGAIPAVHRKVLVLQGRLLAGQGRPGEAMPYFEEALAHYGKVDAGLRMVSDLALLGYYAEALHLLDLSEDMLAAQTDEQLQRPRHIFESDIAGLRAALLEDLEHRAPSLSQRATNAH